MTTTTEKVHGLLHLEGDEVTVQWRLARKTDYLGGDETHTNEEFEAVQKATIPISAISGANVRRPWWRFWSGPRIVLLASDLQALEAVAGQDGLRLAQQRRPRRQQCGQDQPDGRQRFGDGRLLLTRRWLRWR